MRLILVFLASFALFLSAAASTYSVNARSLNLRTAPSTDVPIANVLKKDTKVEVVEVEGDWAVIDVNGQRYYAASEYLAKYNETPLDVSAPKMSKLDDFLSNITSLDLSKSCAHSSDVPFYIAVVLLVCFSLAYGKAGGD